METLAQAARGVGVADEVPPGLDLALEIGDGERPRAEPLRQPPLEVEELSQPSGVLLNRELAAHLTRITRELVGISGLSHYRRRPLLRARNRRYPARRDAILFCHQSPP